MVPLQESNHEHYANKDAVFTMAYAVIMLNVDQHNTNIKQQKPMTVDVSYAGVASFAQKCVCGIRSLRIQPSPVGRIRPSTVGRLRVETAQRETTVSAGYGIRFSYSNHLCEDEL